MYDQDANILYNLFCCVCFLNMGVCHAFIYITLFTLRKRNRPLDTRPVQEECNTEKCQQKPEREKGVKGETREMFCVITGFS